MQPVSNKVVAAAGAAGSVTGPMVIVMALLAWAGFPGITMPPPELIGAAVAQVLAQASTLIGGYMKRELNLPAEGETK